MCYSAVIASDRAVADMDRAMLLDHLEMAKRHVAEGEVHIANQKIILAELERDGHDTVEARRLLANFLDLQELHRADLDRILSELGRPAR